MKDPGREREIDGDVVLRGPKLGMDETDRRLFSPDGERGLEVGSYRKYLDCSTVWEAGVTYTGQVRYKTAVHKTTGEDQPGLLVPSVPPQVLLRGG